MAAWIGVLFVRLYGVLLLLTVHFVSDNAMCSLKLDFSYADNFFISFLQKRINNSQYSGSSWSFSQPIWGNFCKAWEIICVSVLLNFTWNYSLELFCMEFFLLYLKCVGISREKSSISWVCSGISHFSYVAYQYAQNAMDPWTYLNCPLQCGRLDILYFFMQF